MNQYREFADQNVRLIVLRALAEETSATMNDAMLLAVLETFGHFKTKDYLRAQLAFLENEVGAVSTLTAGSAVIAKLTQAGLDHVKRRRELPGVQVPSLE